MKNWDSEQIDNEKGVWIAIKKISLQGKKIKGLNTSLAYSKGWIQFFSNSCKNKTKQKAEMGVIPLTSFAKPAFTG